MIRMKHFSDRLDALMKREGVRPYQLDMTLKDAGLRGRNFARRATHERAHDDTAATFALIAQTLKTDCNYLIAGQGEGEPLPVPEPATAPTPVMPSLTDEQRAVLALAEVIGMREALKRLALATHEPNMGRDDARPLTRQPGEGSNHSGPASGSRGA